MLPLLCFFAFLAGFIDSIVGGGGLIQLPALLILLPSYPNTMLLGTNKCSSIAGTATASLQFVRKVAIRWRITLPAMATAGAFAFLGARAVSVFNPNVLRPLMLVLLILMAVYTFIRKDFGALQKSRLPAQYEPLAAAMTGAVLGFYDGFFGPGTGSLLIFAFIGLLGLDFLTASASAKLVNFSTNLASILYFFITGQILWWVGLPMAICNMSGAYLGSRLAILKGSQFVRVLFLCVLMLVIARYAYDVFKL